MARSTGKRFEEPKLNMKKVFAVILAIIVIIMSIVMIVGLLSNGESVISAKEEEFFAIFKDNKWGVISNNNEIIIEPSYEEMIIIPNSEEDVFICTYDVDYATGEYKTKVLDSNNKEVFTMYQEIVAIPNKYENGQMWYEDDVLKITENGKYGLIDLAGKKILNTEYDSIESILGISDVLKVEKDGKFGIVNLEGKKILENQYLDIQLLGSDSKSGFIVKNEQNLYGVINYSGEIALEIKYEKIEQIAGNSLYVISEQGKQKVVNNLGEVILEDGFDEIIRFGQNGTSIIYIQNDKYGVMDTSKQVLINPEYDGIKEAKSEIFIVEQNGKYGIIDIDNNVKVDFVYNNISYSKNANIYIAENQDFTNEFYNSSFELKQTGYLIQINSEKAYIEIKQNDEYKYYDYTFSEKNVTDIYPDNTLYISKKDGKYGFVDKDGNIVVEHIYDDATKQNEYGYAGIKQNGKWGSIDSEGEVIQDPIYNLDEYLIIDFIGMWHYGKDLNMNYYNQI